MSVGAIVDRPVDEAGRIPNRDLIGRQRWCALWIAFLENAVLQPRWHGDDTGLFGVGRKEAARERAIFIGEHFARTLEVRLCGIALCRRELTSG